MPEEATTEAKEATYTDREQGKAEREIPVQPDEPPDWLLAMFVDKANTIEAELEITLVVGGFLVSGIMISGKKYFEALGQEFASAIRDDQAAERLRERYASIGDSIYGASGVSGLSTELPIFIHLRDARFFNTGGKPIPDNRPVLWRGRLAQVSGFSLGTLTERV